MWLDIAAMCGTDGSLLDHYATLNERRRLMALKIKRRFGVL